MTERLTHFDPEGRPQMVDVSHKPDTVRKAVARAVVEMAVGTRQRIETGSIQKGDVFTIAQLAGIMAAKRTSEVIPLCHPVPITKATVRTEWLDDAGDGRARLSVVAEVETTYKTGVEMEALTACTMAALTVYDMCKSVDRGITVQEVALLHKSGGMSGTFQRI